MASRISAAALLLAASVQAHFQLVEPKSIGFSDDEEGKAPCGSFTPNFDKDTITDFHVGGQPIAVLSGHPEYKWLFRVTFDESVDGEWQQIYDIVDQQGLGAFCIPDVTVPDSWVGKTGVLGIVGGASDGNLYQCASVKFVDGVGSAGGDCKNATDVKGSFTSDASLEALATATINPSSAATGSDASASATTGSDSSKTATDAAASATSSDDSAGSHVETSLISLGLVLSLAWAAYTL